MIINDSFLTRDNDYIFYSEDFYNNSNLIKISENNVGIIRYFFSRKKIIPLNKISFKYNKKMIQLSKLNYYLMILN